jgi:phthiocerol/phenolphthiocerol synthesis type-I polyketide synthase E
MKREAHQGSEMVSASATHSAASPAGPTRDSTEASLNGIWREQLGVDAVNPDDNFFDLGGDSSIAVRIFAQIDQIFGIKLPLATLYDAPTVRELALILRGEVASSGWSPLVAIQPLGSRPPLFCMHGAGGTVLMYRDLSRHLGDDQPFYGLQCQGLDGSCAPLTKIEEMAAVYVREIRKVQPQGPYFIAGYCMGGTVAYEVAQQFQQQGETVALLALFDTMNWHRIPLNAWRKTLYNCQRLFFHAASFLSLDFVGKKKFFKEKAEILRNRIPVWRGKLQGTFGKPAEGAASDSLLLAQIWQINDRASWNYIAKPFAGFVTDIRPAKQYLIFSKPEFKWEQLAQGGQEVTVLPVNPATMLVEPFVAHLAAALRQSVNAAMARSGAGSSA